MDSLGKVFDIFILIIVLFILPVNWAMARSQQSGREAIGVIAEDFLAASEETGEINFGNLTEFDNRLKSLMGNYSTEISVKRRIWDMDINAGSVGVIDFDSEIPYGSIINEMASTGAFKLYGKDTLIIKIYGKDGYILSKMRLII